MQICGRNRTARLRLAENARRSLADAARLRTII
jgi:hypothetical protein